MRYLDLKSNRNLKVKKGKILCKNKFLWVSFGGFLLFFGAFLLLKFLPTLFNPVSVVGTISKAQKANLKQSDGRTNILILGIDERTKGAQTGSLLTDSIIIVSIRKVDSDVAMISIPRDLWVKSSKGGYYKINEIYAVYGGKEGGGMQELLSIVQEVLGVPIHYYAVVNFTLFKEVIDILGGVEVNVENSFTDNLYPIEGMEDAQPESARYESVHFEKGLVKMDGETALKYVRSRHGDNGEGTDFARAKRQQNLIKAIKDKVKSTNIIIDFPKVKALYETYSNNLDNNFDLAAVELLYKFAIDGDFNNIRSLILDDRNTEENGGLLYSPTDLTLYGGRYVLLPRAGHYLQIHAYVKKYLFEQ